MADWTPQAGSLIVRILLGLPILEIQLLYRDNPENDSHYLSIAEIHNFRASAQFCGYVESCLGQQEHTGSGFMIVRRPATNSHLEAFRKLWTDQRPSIDDWLKEVQRLPRLDPAEKERLRKIFS